MRLLAIAAVAFFATKAAFAQSTMDPRLAGVWTSTPETIALTSAFDESVWGPKASSVRTVRLELQPSGEGTLTVTRKVVDARGRTVANSTSVEHATLRVGAASPPSMTRIEHDVTVTKAERTYPDDPKFSWAIDGLKVKLVTFEDDKNARTVEVRFDTPEGKGSFWETLRKSPAARKAASLSTSRALPPQDRN
jgi:hypothetical protein